MRATLSQPVAAQILRDLGVGSRIALLGLRGFFNPDTGRTTGIYSDVIALVTPSVFAAFNANTDASPHRRVSAVLQPGIWQYRLGIHGLSKPQHKQYMALVQAGRVEVFHKEKIEYGWFGMDIHRGGYSTVSGQGCQAIFPDQWPAFIALVEQEMKREGHTVIPYALTVYQPDEAEQ